MKITNARSWIVNAPWNDSPGDGSKGTRSKNFVFIQVDTYEGVTGWGEITTYPGPVVNGAIAAFVDQIGAWLIGENPEDIERIWAKIFRGLTYIGTRGATTSTSCFGLRLSMRDIQPTYPVPGVTGRAGVAVSYPPTRPATMSPTWLVVRGRSPSEAISSVR